MLLFVKHPIQYLFIGHKWNCHSEKVKIAEGGGGD